MIQINMVKIFTVTGSPVLGRRMWGDQACPLALFRAGA